jgi:hypothetical protein
MIPPSEITRLYTDKNLEAILRKRLQVIQEINKPEDIEEEVELLWRYLGLLDEYGKQLRARIVKSHG